MLNNKKGIELSINMIVVIILGLAMLGVGFSIFYSAYNETVNVKETVDSQTQQQLNDLLDSGEAIVIPINTKDVDRGDYVDFDLGISNELDGPRIFFVYIRFDTYAGRGDDSLLSSVLNKRDIDDRSCATDNSKDGQNCADKWLLMSKRNSPDSYDKYTDVFLLDANVRHSIPLRFVLPKKIRQTMSANGPRMGLPAGQYIFNVDVFAKVPPTNYNSNSPNSFDSCNTEDSDENGDPCKSYFSKKKIYIKVN